MPQHQTPSMTLQDDFNHYLATNRIEAEANLAAMAAGLARDEALQLGSDQRRTLTAAPLLLGAEEYGRLSTIAQTMCSLQAGVPHLLNGLDATLRDNSVPAGLHPFINAQIPYSVNISRCDFLHASDGWYLSEINTGPGCAGITVHEYNDRVTENPFLVKYYDANSCTGTAPLDALAETVLERCAALSIDANPTVAIADWQGALELCDIENSGVAEKYLRHGFSTIICHQRELSYAHGRLWCSGRPVDVLHRLFILEDIIEDPASALPVLAAAADGAIVLVSTFLDEWAAYKHTFALFHQAADAGLLPEHVAELVAQSVPRTWRLADGGAGHASGGVADSADHLVIKPVIGHSGHGVVLGPASGRASFDRAVEAVRASGEAHVMQRFIASLPVKFPWLDHGSLTFADAQLHPGVFVIEGRVEGLWTRLVRGNRPQMIIPAHGSCNGGVWYEHPEPMPETGRGRQAG